MTPPPDLADRLALDWLDLSLAPRFAGWTGRLGMTSLPGTRRALEADAAQLAADGVTTFVLLVEDHELTECGVESFVEVMAFHGVETVRFPIVDQNVPTDAPAFAALLDGVEARLKAGQAVAVSCRGGLGRTGTLAAGLLVDGGMAADVAISATRAARKGTIETDDQEAFIRRWPQKTASRT